MKVHFMQNHLGNYNIFQVRLVIPPFESSVFILPTMNLPTTKNKFAADLASFYIGKNHDST